MKKIVLVFLAQMMIGSTFAYDVFWKKIDATNAPEKWIPNQQNNYAYYALDHNVIQLALQNVGQDAESSAIITLPKMNGEFAQFKIWLSDLMPEALMEKFPDIRAYNAVEIGHPSVSAKITITPFGFSAMIFDRKETRYIDPIRNSAEPIYQMYKKTDYVSQQLNEFVCQNGIENHVPSDDEAIFATKNELPQLQFRKNGEDKRAYRLALACTGEYANAVAGPNPTKANVLAAMVTTMNRVNGIYERELSLTMVLIPNNDTLIYLDGNADPYSNSSGGTMLGQNQTNLTTLIGTANFDIGHVFSTGGGGIASLASVCNNNNKARGVTGSSNPVGDPFDVDYVAHEMGHQFGGSHTFNSNISSCGGGNRSNNNAYEPGSGSTIQAYAGICGSDNLQSHSDAYFHSRSLQQMSVFISNISSGGSCPTVSPSGNDVPDVSPFSANYFIPSLTPFELEGPLATDNNHAEMTYCWEQWDRGDYGKSIANTFLAGPIFRTFIPDTVNYRVFPMLDSLLNGTTIYRGEKLPDSNRKLTFKLTVRDVFNGYGAFNFSDDSIRLTVVHTGQPFAVTFPSDPGIQATITQKLNVTWNVVGTNSGQINCQNVDIFLSLDGGRTWPHQLASSVPNDGQDSVLIPNVPLTTTARIKVKGAGNVFFDISNYNFELRAPGQSIDDVVEMSEINIFPNPADHFVYVRIDGYYQKDLNGRITDVQGSEIWVGKIEPMQKFDVSKWAAGVYYLQIEADNGRKVAPIVVH